jgi:antitoxin MazE5
MTPRLGLSGRGTRRVDVMPQFGHDRGMSRVRVSTTVDEALLADARRAMNGQPDAVVIDEALRSLLLRRRSAELDAEYAAYDAHPLDEPDQWGDLASFREAAAAT